MAGDSGPGETDLTTSATPTAVATPSVFIVDLDGTIVWSYVGQNAADRPGADTILSHLPDGE